MFISYSMYALMYVYTQIYAYNYIVYLSPYILSFNFFNTNDHNQIKSKLLNFFFLYVKRRRSIKYSDEKLLVYVFTIH